MTHTQPDALPRDKTDLPTPLPTDLGGDLVAHLGREADALEGAAALQGELNRALRAAAPEAIEQAAANLATFTRTNDALRARRAALLGPLTVRQIADRLPAAQRQALDAARDRVAELARAAAALARRNEALARQGLAFVHERLLGLAGETPGGRYGADGRAVAPRRTPLLLAQG